MNRLICIWAALAIMAAAAPEALALDGSWRGELTLGRTSLPLVFNFSETESGETRCTLDSPAQGAKGIPTEVTYCSADSISLTASSIGASYAGTVTPGSIKGRFSQRGYEFPLDLTPDAPEASEAERRPQTPAPPFPYTATDTAFTARDGAVMSATLTIPLDADSRKIPAVVMVTGSGPQNRDEELFGHRPFAVIADYLARRGIATLRYDDRGTGRSGGDFATATTYTFRDDAAAGIDFLRSVGCIGPTGVLGHSEGGTVAFMLAADGKADFVVSLAGMALPGRETIMRQNRRSLAMSGLSEADMYNSLRMIELIFDAVAEQTERGETAPVDIDTLAAREGVSVPAAIMPQLRQVDRMRSPWLDAFLALDPRLYLAKVKCPVLAVNGDKDTQVSPDNLEVIRGLVPHAEVMPMPGLNHLMQHAATGEVAEYAEISETISPDVLEAVARFIASAVSE